MTERFTLSDKKYDGTIFDDGKSMGCIWALPSLLQ